MSSSQEREGEEEQPEVQLEPQVKEADADADADAVDPTLGILPLVNKVEGEAKGVEDAEAKEADADADADAEEADADEDAEEDAEPLTNIQIRAKKEQKVYEDQLSTFYSARHKYFRGPDSATKLVNSLLKLHPDSVSLYDKPGNFFIIMATKPEEVDDEKEESGILFFPEEASYTLTGNLTFKGVDIDVPDYRPYTKEELYDKQTAYETQLKKAQRKYEKAHANMRTQSETGSPSDKKRAMVALQQADFALLNARYPQKEIYMEAEVFANTLLFTGPTDDKKYEEVGRFIGSTLTMENRYVTSEPLPEAAPPLNPLNSVIVINTPEGDLGSLSNFHQIDFTVEGIPYNSPFKAILSLLATEVDKKDILASMASILNPRDLIDSDIDIRYGIDEGTIETNLENILRTVLGELFTQKSEMAAVLRSTGESLLVVVPQERPLDSFLGTGIDPKLEDIRDPKKWKGKRTYGVVLEEIRTNLNSVGAATIDVEGVGAEEEGEAIPGLEDEPIEED